MPAFDRYLEDLEAGATFEFGEYVMTEDNIIAFAQQFDPQPFHTERNPPADSAHARLIASGWHTCAATMRMMVDNFISWRTFLPSPGSDELRFVRPVFPGDRLRIRASVVSVRPSASKLDRGIAIIRVETLNQADKVVLGLMMTALVLRRPHAA